MNICEDGYAGNHDPKQRSEFGKMTLSDLLEALQGIPLETEIVISHDDRKYNIQGVYYESSEFDVSKNNAPVELEIGVWRNE